MPDRFKESLTPLFLFAAANLFMGLYAGLYDPSFNNYLEAIHHVSEVARGGLEFPRELPGFLTVFIFALLVFLPDTRIAMVAAFLVGISLWGQGFLAPEMNTVVIWMLIWSTGAHLFMVLKSSIALRMAEDGQAGTLLGRLGGLESAGTLIGMMLLYWGVSHLHFSFGLIFGISGTFALLAGLCLYIIKPEPIKKPQHNIMLKKKYTLFYILNMLFGARKQVFLTFAPWVLIKIFNCGVDTFALLGLIGTALSLFFRPFLGKIIDSRGERFILVLDAVTITAVCIFYGFAYTWFPAKIALGIIMICYIIDQLFFAVSIARNTYLNRIIERQEDIAPTISMGVTLDHLVSMLVPFGGGLLWANYGFQWVFMTAAGIAVLMLVASIFIPPLTEQEITNQIETL